MRGAGSISGGIRVETGGQVRACGRVYSHGGVSVVAVKVPVRDPISGVTVYALVDDDADARIQQKRWSLRNGYAYGNGLHPTKRRFRPGKGFDKKSVLSGMHRMILGLKTGDKIEVDHINGNRLDNRLVNLRLVDRAANAQNRRQNKQSAGSSQPWSPFRGVHWEPKMKKWRAVVRGTFLGLFDSDLDAHHVATSRRQQCMPYSEMDREERQ